MSVIGKRKLIVVLAYLLVCPLLVWLTGSPEGVAAIMVAVATGVASFMWGNAKENGTNK
jgi:Flp pilus assembly protein TadB